jgi:hypothetical protein
MTLRRFAPLLAPIALVSAAGAAGAATIRVPGDRPTVQAGIDAARDGDVVLVAPGIYREEVRIAGKAITLASLFLENGEAADVEKTVLESRPKSSYVVRVEESAGPATRIVGFTIRDGDDGVSCAAAIEIAHNRFLRNKDALDYEGGGGVCRNNLFEHNRDDGVDLDKDCAVTIEDNVIRDNGDDGIEIRLHEYSGPVLRIVVRGNVISGNEEDGIQLIDYPDRSDRELLIERNLFRANAMAAVGCMSDGNTKENYEAADIPEPIELVGNTFVANRYGVCGGDNVLLLNNVFLSTRKSALKRVDGRSVVSHVLFWKNGRDDEGSALDGATVLRADPKLDDAFRPLAGSPCVDAGCASFETANGRRYVAPAGSYEGAAPELGAFELSPD